MSTTKAARVGWTGGSAIPELETERLRLRRWRPDSDVPAYTAIVRDPEVMRMMGSGVLFGLRRAASSVVALVSDIEAARAIGALERHWHRHGFGEWAVEEKATGELIGQVGLVHQADWWADPAKVEVGWTLARRAWGKGYATEGGAAAVNHAFTQLGLDRLISIARHDHHRSQQVMRRLGLHRQGKARWRGSDMVWYAIDRGEWPRR